MYRIDKAIKQDPMRRWQLPDRVFFAAGACHILAYAFLQRHATADFEAFWIKPHAGYTGNHIIVRRGDDAFDYHGYTHANRLLHHIAIKANRWWPGWGYDLVRLPTDVLISEAKSCRYEGLWLREPSQYLHDPLLRAASFLDQFPAPDQPVS